MYSFTLDSHWDCIHFFLPTSLSKAKFPYILTSGVLLVSDLVIKETILACSFTLSYVNQSGIFFFTLESVAFPFFKKISHPLNRKSFEKLNENNSLCAYNMGGNCFPRLPLKFYFWLFFFFCTNFIHSITSFAEVQLAYNKRHVFKL